MGEPHHNEGAPNKHPQVVDARLYLSGWIVLPVLFLFGGINGVRAESPILFVAVAVAGFSGVLTVKYWIRFVFA